MPIDKGVNLPMVRRVVGFGYPLNRPAGRAPDDAERALNVRRVVSVCRLVGHLFVLSLIRGTRCRATKITGKRQA